MAQRGQTDDTYTCWHTPHDSFGIVVEEPLESFQPFAPGIYQVVGIVTWLSNTLRRILNYCSQNSSTADRGGRYFDYEIDLYRAALKGDWEATERILDGHPERITAKISNKDDNILHIAAVAGHTKFVRELISRMEKDQLLIKNGVGNTALCLAALSNSIPTAMVLAESNPRLLITTGKNGGTPIKMAAELGHGNMVNCLLRCSEEFHHQQDLCVDFLISFINSDLYDIALEILTKCPNLATQDGSWKQTALGILATKTQTCRRSNLSFWRRNLNLRSFLPSTVERRNCQEEDVEPLVLKLVRSLWECVIQNESLSKDDITNLIRDPVFDAAKAGNVEFLRVSIHSYPDVIWFHDGDDKTIFHFAIENRQEEVFRLIHDTGALKDMFTMYLDEKGNSMLDLAARLPASIDRLNCIPGPALQMQHEVLWYKAVEDIMKPQNAPYEEKRILFMTQHEELREKGEKWMRKTAASYGLVATLIAGIAFTSGVSFPVAWKDSVHHGKRIEFAISDASSLIFSTSSILVLVSILTSRCAHEDFIKVLPLKLASGIVLLIVALVAMMITFMVTLHINFKYSAIWIASTVTAGTLMFIISFCHGSTFTTILRLIVGSKLQRPLPERLF